MFHWFTVWIQRPRSGSSLVARLEHSWKTTQRKPKAEDEFIFRRIRLSVSWVLMNRVNINAYEKDRQKKSERERESQIDEWYVFV